MKASHPAEFMAYLDSAGANDEAAVLRTQQHSEGFRANCKGAELQDFRPAAWQEGWLDAHDLGEFAPVEYFRMEAEA